MRMRRRRRGWQKSKTGIKTTYSKCMHLHDRAVVVVVESEEHHLIHISRSNGHILHLIHNSTLPMDLNAIQSQAELQRPLCPANPSINAHPSCSQNQPKIESQRSQTLDPHITSHLWPPCGPLALLTDNATRAASVKASLTPRFRLAEHSVSLSAEADEKALQAYPDIEVPGFDVPQPGPVDS